MGLTKITAVKVVKLSKFRKYFGGEETELADGLDIESDEKEGPRISPEFGAQSTGVCWCYSLRMLTNRGRVGGFRAEGGC